MFSHQLVQIEMRTFQIMTTQLITHSLDTLTRLNAAMDYQQSATEQHSARLLLICFDYIW